MAVEDTEIEVLPVPAPTMGIIGNVPSTMLHPRACVDCNNVVFKDGILQTRTGYVAYGSGTIADFPLLLFRYQKWSGQEHEMLATASNVYYNNNGVWTSIASGLSGDIEIKATMAYIENYLVFSNGVDAPSKWDGDSWSALNAEHSSDDIDWGDYRPLIFLPFHFRLVGLNDNKPTTGAAIRIMYSHAGNFDKIDGESYSGYIEMTQGMGSKIVGAAPLKNYIGVYKNYSCSLLSYIGGESTFAINVQIEGIGLVAKDAIAVVGTSHIFLGSDLNIYRWNGGTELEPIGNPIKKLLRAEISRSHVSKSFTVLSKEQREVILFVPVNGEQFPSRMWIYNLDDESWSKGTIGQKMTGCSVTSSGVERILLGTRGSSDYVSWYYQYEGNVKPDADGWTLQGTDYASVSAGVLTIDTTGNVAYKCSYLKFGSINLGNGFTIKFRAKVTTAALGAFHVFPADGANGVYYQLYLTTSAVYHEGTKICDFDTTDGFHVYRIYSVGTTAYFFIDGVHIDSWTMISNSGVSLISFGDASTDETLKIEIDYLYYGQGGEEVIDDIPGGINDPDAPTSSIYHYDYEALDDGGTAISTEFETGDFVLDKIEHLIRNRRFYGVGLDLKGYSTSSNLKLEFSLDEGVTWDTTDAATKALTAAYALYNWDFMQTTRKIRFKFSDATSGQKWYLRFYGIKQKEGERV